jgi:Xaa-Pro aminopeptidase
MHVTESGKVISAAEFRRRRVALLNQLPDDTLVLLPAASQVMRSRDTEFPFRQHSDFWYLTGCSEPDAVLLLGKQGHRARAVLFCHPNDPQHAQWHGLRVGPEGAVAQLGVDAAYPLAELEQQFCTWALDKVHLAYPLAVDAALDQRVASYLQQLRSRQRLAAPSLCSLIDVSPTIHELRLFKSPAELKLLRKAAAVSATAHRRAMQRCRPGLNERDLAAELQHEFQSAGAAGPAYNSIVAGGANACILHYTRNSDALRDGDLVLIDAGCEYQYYAADITRTFPVNGHFSPEQRALYDLVLAAQRAALAAIVPGERFDRVQVLIERTLTAGLKRLGILQGRLPSLLKAGAYKPFFMHRYGHWLGLDVHDVGAYQTKGRWRVFEPGMVLTVEPGLYIAADQPDVDPRWRGIGIRIEDDVLVTAVGVEVLTTGVPSDPEAIEALMREAVA